MPSENTPLIESNVSPKKPHLVVMTEYDKPPELGTMWLFGTVLFVLADDADDAMWTACSTDNPNLIPIAAYSVEQLTQLLAELQSAALSPSCPVVEADDDDTRDLLAQAIRLMNPSNTTSPDNPIV